METRIVNKIDVVSAQIIGAVRLFFNNRDLIVIHTIVASAHQILFDLGNRVAIEGDLKKLSGLEPKEAKDFLKSVNYPYNFFKHADQDPDGSINVEPLIQLTADFLMDAIFMLQSISGRIPIEAKIFWTWFVSFYHEQFDNLPLNGEIAKMQSQMLGSKSFSEISTLLVFAEMSEVAAQPDVQSDRP